MFLFIFLLLFIIGSDIFSAVVVEMMNLVAEHTFDSVRARSCLVISALKAHETGVILHAPVIFVLFGMITAAESCIVPLFFTPYTP